MISVKPSLSPLAVRDFTDSAARIISVSEYTRAAQMLLLGGFAGLAARWAIRAFKASCDNAD